MTDPTPTPPAAPPTAPAGAPANTNAAPAEEPKADPSTKIPVGIYVGRATHGAWCKSKNDKDYVDLVVEFAEGPFRGRTMDKQLYFSDEKNELRSLESLGYAGVDITSADATINLTGLGTKNFRFTVETTPARPNPDKPGEFFPERTGIGWINALEGGPTGRASTVEEKAVMKGRLAGLIAKRGTVAAPSAQGAPPAEAGSFDKF